MSGEHPAHLDCAGGCGLAVTHDGACRTRPGGAVVCGDANHYDEGCDGHESTDGPIGNVLFCDGTCRPT